MRVLCVMLVNGRPEMVNRAIRSFQCQTYQEKSLLVFDSGPAPVAVNETPNLHYRRLELDRNITLPIGTLRNMANESARPPWGYDYIAHWDSDDWSHPLRLAEQVAMIESTGAEAVGYREMLFWKHGEVRFDERFGNKGFGSVVETDATIEIETGELVPTPGQAWLFTSPNPTYCLGTSLLYHRAAWERRPFPKKNTAEDTEWCLRVKTSATSAGLREPRMIASIHGANTCAKIKPGAKEWMRVCSLDKDCARRMQL